MAQSTESKFPEWMKATDNYSPKKDKENFISKSILNFLKLFRHFHVNKSEVVSTVGAGMRTLLVLGLIILSSISRSLFFTGSFAAGFLLYLSFTKLDVLKKVLSTSLVAALFTFLIMLPSFLLYKSNSFITITAKVFLSTGAVSLYALLTPWNKITGALQLVRIPGFIIFILDLTIHYILILGNIAFEMLNALKLRSIGKNKNKKNSFSGILGTLFLKSTAFSQETQQSMECRMFDGTYTVKKQKPQFKDFIPLFALMVYIILFAICNH